MKRVLLFTTLVALVCTVTSCMRDDDWEMFNHPIHITGEIDPVLGFPVASGEMNMNDLLANLSSDYAGIVNADSNIITVEYSISSVDTVYASSFMNNSKRVAKASPKAPRMNPLKNGPKVDFFTKDTILEDVIDIDFFNDVKELDSLTLAHVWVDLSVSIKGDIPQNYSQYAYVTFDSIQLWYDDSVGTHKRYYSNEVDLESYHVDIPDLSVGVHEAFPTMDMASMVNERPQRMYARYHLKLRVSPQIITQNIANMAIQDIIDTLGMTYITYSADLQVHMPMTARISNMDYKFDLDLGEGLSSVNLDSVLQNINEGLSAEVTESMFCLSLSNNIPLNLNLTAGAYSEDSVLLWTAFSDELIPSAVTAPMANDPLVEESVSPTSTVLETTLNRSDIENLNNSKYLRVNIRVNSNNKHVAVKKSDMLKIKAYLQIHPTVGIDIEL